LRNISGRFLPVGRYDNFGFNVGVLGKQVEQVGTVDEFDRSNRARQSSGVA
jgi:hypothetical protein